MDHVLQHIYDTRPQATEQLTSADVTTAGAQPESSDDRAQSHNTGDDSSGNNKPAKKSMRVVDRVRAPALEAGKKLGSAIVYGEHLYIVEAPMSDVRVVFYATDVNQLLQLDDEATPNWMTHCVTLDQSVKAHVGDVNRATVKLFATTMKNPVAT